MLRIITSTTHSKMLFDKCDVKEKARINSILKTKFTFRDKKKEREKLVLLGLESPYVSLYIEDKQILPTGFIPWLKLFLKEAGIEFTITDIRKFPEYDKSIFDENFVLGKLKPRDYQIEAVKAVIKKRGGGIQIPTGTGKGMVHAMLCRAFHKSRILNLFDEVELIHQTRKAFIEKYGFDESEVGIVQGVNCEEDKRVILLSVDSYEKIHAEFPTFNVIIGDEAHTTLRSPTAEKIIYSCQKASTIIGLSATLDKLDNPFDQGKLYSIMGPIVYRNELIDKINDETLAKVEVHICKYDSPSPEIKKNYADLYEKHKIKDDDKHLWDGIDGWEVVREKNLKTDVIETIRRKKIEDGNESTHYVYNKQRNDAIAKIASMNKRVLIIFNRVEHGQELQKLIPGSILIHGDNNQIERYKAEKELKENENAVILSSRIWQTGKDIPEIETVIHVSGGRSSIMVIQRIGRGTRQSHETNKKKAIFYDFDDSHLSSIGFNQFSKRLSVYKKAQLPIKVFNISEIKSN